MFMPLETVTFSMQASKLHDPSQLSGHPSPSYKFLLDKHFHKLIILRVYICQHADRNICLVKVGTICCSGKKPDCLPDGCHRHFILQPCGRKRALLGNLYAGCQAPVYLSENADSCCYRKLYLLKQVK